MNKQELINYFTDKYGGQTKAFYYADEDLLNLQELKEISSFEEIDSTIGDDHRWGHYREDVFKFDDYYILFMIYVHSGDYGDNYLEDVYEVVPEEKVITAWVAAGNS